MKYMHTIKIPACSPEFDHYECLRIPQLKIHHAGTPKHMTFMNEREIP